MGISYSISVKQWHAQSKLRESLQVERLPGSSWPPRRQGSLPLPLAELRSPTATGLVLLPCGRSEGTRNPPSCSSASSPSSAWFEIAQDFKTDLRFQSSAVMALQEA